MNLKNIFNLKVESCVLFCGIFKTSNLEDNMSSNPERTTLRRQEEEEEEPGYTEVCSKGQVVRSSNDDS